MASSFVADGDLLAFLGNTLSPDADTQKQNIQVLEQLTAAPTAHVIAQCVGIFSFKTVVNTNNVSDGGRPSSLRLAAGSVLRRLLKANPQGVVAAVGSPEAMAGHLSSLVAAATQDTNATTRSAACAAIPALICACSSNGGSNVAAYAVVSGVGPAPIGSFLVDIVTLTLRHGIRAARGQVGSAPDGSAAPPREDVCTFALGATAVLRALFEDCPKEYRDYLGDSDDSSSSGGGATPQARSLALCTDFDALLAISQQALCCALSDSGSKSGGGCSVGPALRVFSATLAALAACFKEDILPVEHPFDDLTLNANGDDGFDGGAPAMAALRAVIAETARLHSGVTQLALQVVLPWISSSSGSGGEGGEVGGNAQHQQHPLPTDTESDVENKAAAFLALAEYMAPMALAAGSQVAQANEAFLSASLPVMTLALWPHATSTAATTGGAGKIVESAVNASLGYLSDIALLGSGHSPALSEGLPLILNSLLSLAALQAAVLSSREYAAKENDLAIPDDPSTVKIVLDKAHSISAAEFDSDSGSSDGDHGATDKNNDSNDSDDDDDDDNEEGEGSVRRGLISTLLNNISVAYGDSSNGSGLVEYLFPPTLSILSALNAASGTAATAAAANPCLAEAALFVLNNVVEGCLTARTVTAAQVRHVASVASALMHLLTPTAAATAAPCDPRVMPFYLRLQAIRFLSRTAAAAVEALLRTCPSPVTELLDVLRPDRLMVALADMVGSETSKCVQRRCVAALVLVCIAALRTTTDDLDDDDDDSDEDQGNYVGGGSGGHSLFTADALTSAQAFSGQLRSVLFSNGDDSPIQAAIARLLSAFPALQLGPRIAVYNFLSSVLPRLADRGIPLHAGATEAILEMLAAQCTRLVPQQPQQQSMTGGATAVFPSEAAYLLVTISQVVTGLGPLTAPALPFFAHLARHVIGLHTTAHGISTATTVAGVDAEDMCELAMDLLSALCDAMLDRDALLLSLAVVGMETTTMTTGTGPAPGDAGAAQLRAALGCDAAATGAGGDSTLEKCMAVLAHCHATEVGASIGGGGMDDVHGGLRRACYGLIYDSLFLSSPEARAAAFWPLLDATVLRELSAFTAATSERAAIEAINANEAATNAFMCLGEVLFLCRGGATLLMAPAGMSVDQARPALQAVANTLLATLSGGGGGGGARPMVTTTLPRSVRLNMVNALGAVAAFLAAWDASTSATATEFMAASLLIVSQEAKHFSSVEEDGLYECVQVLSAIISLLRSFAATSEAASLPAFFSLHAAVATTPAAAAVRAIGAVGKCVRAAPSRQWATAVLGEWAVVAQALQSLGPAVAMTKAEQKAVALVAAIVR